MKKLFILLHLFFMHGGHAASYFEATDAPAEIALDHVQIGTAQSISSPVSAVLEAMDAEALHVGQTYVIAELTAADGSAPDAFFSWTTNELSITTLLESSSESHNAVLLMTDIDAQQFTVIRLTSIATDETGTNVVDIQRGFEGVPGLTGAQGSVGPQGLTGATGAAGAAGSTGANGATGPQGPAGVLAYAQFYALMPPDNAATIAPGSDLDFPQDGPTSATSITRIDDESFNLSEIGVYEVTSLVSVDEAGQFILTLNGADLAYTVAGRATGTSHIMIQALLETTTINSMLTVRNPAGNASALTITPLAGGTRPVSASLIIKQID